METKLTQRWEPNAINWLMGIDQVMHREEQGAFVLYEDHARHVALLELELVNLRQELADYKSTAE